MTGKPENLYAYSNSSTTVYTDTTSPVAGSILYNNLGEDSGMKVDTVNSDGSFTVEEVVETVVITLTSYTAPGAWSGSFEGAVNDISFVSTTNTTTTCEPNTFEVIKGQSCTITATHTGRGLRIILADENANTLAYGDESFTYTFIPLEDCTLQIGSNIEK